MEDKIKEAIEGLALAITDGTGVQSALERSQAVLNLTNSLLVLKEYRQP